MALLCVFALSYEATLARASAFNDPSARGQGAAAGGDLVPVDEVVEGGDIGVGASAQVVVLFRNDSGRALEAGAIQVYPSSSVSALVSLNQCNQEPLQAGATCAVAIDVKGLQPGPWRVEMIMRHSGRARLTRATLSGQVSAGADGADRFVSDIEAIPDELDFETLETSQPIIRGVALRNTTSDPIDIYAIYVEAAEQAGYTLKTDCSHLEPGQACMVIVTWSPVLEGQSSGVLLIEHSGPTRVASVNLLGDFTPEESEEAAAFPNPVPGMGLMVSSQSEIDFGDIETTSAITVSLVNIGDAPLTIERIGLANTDNGLNISNRGCTEGMILAPVEACPLTLTWSPVREGALLDDVQIRHTGARGVLILPVRGSSSGVISQDSRALRLGTGTASLAPGDTPTGGEVFIIREDGVSPATALDGFIVTSHSPKRSIIAGPGGSRIVFDGEEVVIGGFLWYINIRRSGVEFRSGDEKVLLLFDRSLSSINRVSSQSGSGSGASGGSSAVGAAAATN